MREGGNAPRHKKRRRSFRSALLPLYLKSFFNLLVFSHVLDLSEIFETEEGRSPTGVPKILRGELVSLTLITKLTLPCLAA
jgi:hypothetical protein